MQSYDVNIKLKDKNLNAKINAYCNINNLTYTAFATKVFNQFFNDEKRQLEMMTKEQLIETILNWKGKNNE